MAPTTHEELMQCSAANGERIARLEIQFQNLHMDVSEIKTLLIEQRVSADQLRLEMAARREYAKGIKSGFAIMWMLVGGFILTAIENLYI